jgi:hypothetical protein
VRRIGIGSLLLALCLPLSAQATKPPPWQTTSATALKSVDDDIGRYIGTAGYFDGIEISEQRFTENGFAWHLIRFASKNKPEGPLWMVPHDDENAAFEAMISAVKAHGGVGVAINSGPGGVRRQSGDGICGVKASNVSSCDPNRNFGQRTPVFVGAFLSERSDGWPIIALHTNTPGFAGDGQGGRGEITILDRAAYARGAIAPRVGGYFAIKPKPEMANYDTLGLTAYLAANALPSEAAVACGKAIAGAGVHFWHERVGTSDGSMSNYLALTRPDIAYFNAESRNELDLAVAAARHKVMIDAYLSLCTRQKGLIRP